MDIDIKTAIENVNTTSLVDEFSEIIVGAIPIIFPLVGGVAVFFLIFKLFRRIIRV